jgi:TP901 family phage tail tape measure protein
MALTGLPINLEVGLTGVNSASRTLDNLTNQRRVVQLSARLDTRSILSAQKALGQISNNASEFEKSMQAANARVLAFGSAVGVIEGMRRSFVALIKTTVDVENALVKIASISQKELDKAGISIEDYGSKLFRIAKETGQSFDSVGKAALEFARQGLKPIETLERTRDALVLTRLSGLDAVASVEALTAAYNAFKGEVSGTNEILQRLVAVDNASAASAGDLAEGLKRAGFVAKDSGQSLNEMIATIAVLEEATARGGAVIGNSLKTLLVRAQSLENLKLFESLGIETSAEGKLKPVLSLFQELSKVINDPSFTQNKTPILSQLAGNFQINSLSAFLDIVRDLGSQGNRYADVLKIVNGATNEATKQNDAYGKSLAAALNTATVSVEEFLNSLGRVGIKDPFSGLIEKVSSFFSLIQGAVDSEGVGGDIARGIIKGVGGVLFSNTGLILVGAALVKIVKDFVQFSLSAAKGFLEFNKSGREQERIQASISNILATNQGILSGIANTEQGRVILAQRVADIYERQLNAATALSQITKGAAAAIYNEGYRVKDSGISRPRGRAAQGFDPLVTAEMRDVQKGVGGANPNSRVVVMPNFPFGGGKKGLMVANSSETAYKSGTGYGIMNPDQVRSSGMRAADGFSISKGSIRNQTGFADKKSLGAAITLMVNAAILSGKSSKELAAVVNKTIGGFDLVRESFQRVSKEANIWANAMFKQAQQANAQQRGLITGSVGRLNTGGTGFTSSAGISGLGFRRPSSEGPIQGDPFNIANLPQFEKERLQTTRTVKARLAIDNERRRAKQAEQKKLLDERKSLAGRLNERELALGERKNFLSRLKGRKEDVVVNGRSLSASDARRLFSGELSNISKQAASLRSSLSQKDKELFEKFGFDPTQSRPTRISENQRVDQQALKARLQAKFGSRGNSILSSGSGAISGLTAVDNKVPTTPVEVEKVKKTFSDSLGKLFVLGIAAEGLSSAFGDAEGTMGKFTGFLSKAGIALYAISEFSNFGGKSLKDLLPSFGGGKSNFGRGFRVGKAGKSSTLAFAESGLLASSTSARAGRFAGGIAGGVGTAISGITSVGKFLPVIGQVIIGFGLLNEAVRAITGSSIIDKLSLALGGLTDEASKAQERFSEISKELFNSSGKYGGRSNKDSQQIITEELNKIRQLREAKTAGLDTQGKSQGELAVGLFQKRIESTLGGIKTGEIKRGGVVSTGVGSRGYVVPDTAETLANSSESLKAVLIDQLSVLVGQTEDDLRKLLESKGVKSINGVDLSKVGIDKLQDETIKLFSEKILRNFQSIKTAVAKGRGGELIGTLAGQFNKLPTQSGGGGGALNGGFEEKVLDPEVSKKYLEFVKDFNSSLFEGNLAVIEAEIKKLENDSNDPSLTDAAKRKLEAKRNDLLKRALDVGNALENVQFETNKKLIQSQVKDGGKTQEDASREIFLLEQSIGNVNAKYLNNIRQIDLETSSRKKGNDALDKFNRATNAAQSALSSLSVNRAKSNQNISILESESNNPRLNIFERESAQRRANQAKIDDLKTNAVQQAVEQSKLSTAEISKLPQDQQGIRFKEINDNLAKTLIEIQTEISSIEASQNGQLFGSRKRIGFDSNVNAEYVTALEEQRRNLGSNRTQNRINTLQSTDSSGIVSGLIGEQVYGQAEGKTGERLVSFIAEQNALLNEAFKIKTATSQVEKLNLETQLELTKEILAIKNSELSATEKQAAIEKAITDNLAQRRTFSFGVKEARAGMQDQINSFGSDFGKTATEGFRDGLVGAMQAVVSQTGNLKDALLDVALSFANKLRDAALTNLANIITSGLGGGGGSGGIVSGLVGAIGGLFTGGKKAAGGLITGGSGNKDDVPTLLMGGEYVVNKKAVNAYGRNFFESLNNGSVGQMAQGGYFAPGVRGQGTISGKENLLDFATQTATSGKQDIFSSLGAGAGIVSLEPESLRLSNFGRFGDSPIVQATQEAKEQAFGLYLDQLGAEKDYQDQLDAIKKAEKEKKKQFLISLAVAAVGAGLSYGAGKLNLGNSAPKALSASSPAAYNAKTGLFETIKAYQPAASQSTNAFSRSVGTISKGIGSVLNLPSSRSFNGQSYSSSSNSLLPSISQNKIDLADLLQQELYGNIPTRRNSGGSVSGNGDTVPAMLSNKEFVLNSSAAQKIGDKGLYALNSGANPSGGDSEARIVSKLDELIEKTVGASNITINVSTGGGNGEKTESDNSQQSDSNSNEKQRFLMQRLKESVLNVIRDEQRPGGLLTSTRR